MFDTKFASNKLDDADFDLLLGFVRNSETSERFTEAPEHALAQFLAANWINLTGTQLRPRNPAGATAFR